MNRFDIAIWPAGASLFGDGMRAFLYKTTARIILVLGSFSGVILAGWPWVEEKLGIRAEVAALIITILLLLIVEAIFTLIPEVNFQKMQQRMGRALFDDWLKDLKFEDGKSVSGIRINVMLLRWCWIPNISGVPFKKWVVEYRSKGRMEKDPDRNLRFKIFQGWVGAAIKDGRGGFAHFKDLQFSDADAKREFMTRRVGKGGLGLSRRQAEKARHIEAVVTVLLVDNGDAFGALNVDATDAIGADVLCREDVRESIILRAELAEKLYGKGG